MRLFLTDLCARVINFFLAGFYDMACYVCGSINSYLYFQHEKWDVVICRECGHAVTRPFPSDEELASLYNAKYFDSHYTSFEFGSSGFRKKIKDESVKLKKFILPYKSRGELLDIGCGKGYFLKASADRFHPIGFDVSNENASFIKDTLGINIEVNNWARVSFNSQTFDVITLWHSLEHFSDPRSSLRKSMAWLKDDGIVVVNVPMHDCVDSFFMRKDWPNWDVPFHLHHFTKESLHQMLAQLDLEIIQEDTFHSGVIKEVLAQKILFRYFSRNIAKCFDGGHIAVVCRKKVSNN